MKKRRFVSAYLDDDGDPWRHFDIDTAGDIPASVFLKTLDCVSWGLFAVGDEIFEN